MIDKIDADAFERRAGAKARKEGRVFLRRKSRFTVENALDTSVVVRVQDRESHRVRFIVVGDEVNAFCGCLYEGGEPEIICSHKVAAALYLKEKFRPQKAAIVPEILPAARPAAKSSSTARPAAVRISSVANAVEIAAPDWKERLESLLRKEVIPVKPEAAEALLFFSFVRGSQGYYVQPGILPASVAPLHLWNDRVALQRYLLDPKHHRTVRLLSKPLKTSDYSSYRWVNTRAGNRGFIERLLQRSRYNFAFYTQEPLDWEALADELVFRGDDKRLIKEPLEVRRDAAEIEMLMERDEEGVRLSLAAVLPDRKIKLDSPTLKVFHSTPMWFYDEGQLFKAEINHYRYKQLRRLSDILIPRESVPEFFQQNFGKLVDAYMLRDGEILTDPVMGKQPTPRLYLTEERGELRAGLRFAYDTLECLATRNPPIHSYAFDAERDLAAQIERSIESENEWFKRLGQDEFGLKPGYRLEGTAHDVFLLRANIHPFDFLKNYIPKLTAAGVEIYGEADLTMGRINRARPVISFDVTSGIDWFDVKAVVHFNEIEVSLAEIRKSLRKNDRFIKLADGSVGEIPPEWLEKYKHLFGLSETKENGFRLARHHVALLDQLLSDNETITFDKQFEQARAWLKNFAGVRSQTIPKGFQGEMRPYQKAGLDWLSFLRESRFGGCLADDMGIGKTIQALCFLQSLKEQYEIRNLRKRKKEPRAPHLLVVPRSLIHNWIREAEKFTPGLTLLDFSTAERAADLKEFDRYDIVLTTYGVLLREIERLQNYEFDTVILDEAQAIKNPLAESSKAARLIKGRHRITLTGTPIENNTFELWSQFAFLNPGLLGSAEYFREGFTGPIERQNDEQAVKTLRRLVYPFILRRTKDQVELDLPPRTEKILWNEMGPEQRKLYDRTRDEYRAKILKLIEDKGVKDARFRILEGLLRLRQICNHPRLVNPNYKGESAKLEVLLDTIRTLNDEGHKALIFSQFVQMLRLIETGLKKEKYPYSYLDGSTVNRQSRVDAFQTDEQLRFFLISLKAGGVGLNLTAADYVIHVDPWWNPAVEMQASDRAHRIGQKKPVFIYKLMMRDTVEEKILKLQDRKRNLVKQLITTEAGFFKSLTAEDISSLFS